MASKPKSTAKKEISTVEWTFEANGEVRPFIVQTDFDMKKGTYKIKAHITTNHIEPDNEDMVDALCKLIHDNYKIAIKAAIKKKEAWESGESSGQLALEA